MVRTRVLLGVSLALLVTATTADAGWGSHGSSGSSGSRGSSGGRVVYKSWGSHGSRGSHGSWGSLGSHGSSGGGLFARLHARAKSWHHSHGSWGSSRGSRGSWGSSGGSRGSWGSSGGSHGSSGTYYEKKDKGAKEPAKKEALPPKTDKKKKKVSTGDVFIKVDVPEATKVYVNDRLTTSTGGNRQFISRDLHKGLDYTFRIRAELERDGKKLTSTRKLTVQAGQTISVNFDFRQVETKITLVVPEGAKVTLSGQTTTTPGRVRVFSTSKLTKGQSWKDYTIQVSLNKNGKNVTQEKTIDLNGGENRTLTFKFDNDKVATR